MSFTKFNKNLKHTNEQKRIDNEKQTKRKYILNPNNKYITENDILSILKKCEIDPKIIDYRVNKLSTIQRAFIHKSYIKTEDILDEDKDEDEDVHREYEKNCIELQIVSNERLEFLGDSPVGCFVVTYLYHRYPNQNEGFLTRLKTKLVRTEALAKFCRYLELPQFLMISKHVEDMCNGRDNDRLLEDLFESFIGALYRDILNFEYVKSFENIGKAMNIISLIMKHIIEENVDFRELVCDNDNYKEVVQQNFQKKFGQYPKYTTTKINGVGTEKTYTVCILNPDDDTIILGMGEAKKKLDAEQLAAKETILWLKNNL